jgi:hypothetical protein
LIGSGCSTGGFCFIYASLAMWEFSAGRFISS